MRDLAADLGLTVQDRLLQAREGFHFREDLHQIVTLHRLAQEQAEDLFIAHRGYNEHVLRVVYEYESDIPLVVTVYFPYAKRYFQGGGTYADQILS